MKWCKDARNVLAMKKLEWRLPKKALMGDAPDMQMLICHIWVDACYVDPDVN